MKKGLILITSAIFCFSSCTNNEKNAKEGNSETASLTKEQYIERGAYLVQFGGCNDCHSPKRMGANGPEIIPELMLSGYHENGKFNPNKDDVKSGNIVFASDLTAASGPWGTSFAANLTPDATGTGSWTEAQFKKAITEGKWMGMEGTRSILPPMPWQNLAHLNDTDIKSIFSYLQSINPVKNVVPMPISPEENI